ncbi:MAG: glycosyltransferase family 4 protein [Kiritimatiellae bacterium]|nr:glycosyltransferase family 4 protein [Kiritimatiellia bacterium]
MKFSYLFSNGIPVGGVEVSSLRLARALSNVGHDVQLVVHGGLQLDATKLGEMIRDLPFMELPSAENMSIPEMGNAYAALGDTCVFPNQFPRGYEALRYAKKNKNVSLKILGICHSDHEDYYQLAKDNQDIVDIQFGVSKHVCELLDQRLESPSKLLLLGVDVPDAHAERPSRKHLEILYAGRIENYGKRCSELIPAGEWLLKRGVKFHLTIVGNGPYYEWLFDDMKKVPFWRRRYFSIIGAVPPSELATYYERSDIYLSFTKFEGNSIAVMEAMAHGCVPVVARVSGTETVVQHERTGMLGEVDQPLSLLKGVERLFQNPVERIKIARNASDYARRYFNIQTTAEFLEACINGSAGV